VEQSEVVVLVGQTGHAIAVRTLPADAVALPEIGGITTILVGFPELIDVRIRLNGHVSPLSRHFPLLLPNSARMSEVMTSS